MTAALHPHDSRRGERGAPCPSRGIGAMCDVTTHAAGDIQRFIVASPFRAQRCLTLGKGHSNHRPRAEMRWILPRI